MGATEALERYGPVGLVPLAWGFAGAALFTALVDDRTLTIGLGVMTVIFAVFAAHPAMGEGLFRVWRGVLLAGFAANVVALAALFGAVPRPLAGVSLYGWLLLPTVGLVATGRRVAAAGRVYLACAAVSAVGALLFVGGSLALPSVGGLAAVGLALVALAQAASVALAAAQNTG